MSFVQEKNQCFLFYSLPCLSFSPPPTAVSFSTAVLFSVATPSWPLSTLPSSPCHRTSAPPPLQHNTPPAPQLSWPSHHPQLFSFTTLKSHHHHHYHHSCRRSHHTPSTSSSSSLPSHSTTLRPRRRRRWISRKLRRGKQHLSTKAI